MSKIIISDIRKIETMCVKKWALTIHLKIKLCNLLYMLNIYKQDLTLNNLQVKKANKIFYLVTICLQIIYIGAHMEVPVL